MLWSRDTGQPCFDSCQLAITWISNVKDVRCKPRLHALVDLLAVVFYIFKVDGQAPLRSMQWPPCCATSSSSSSSSLLKHPNNCGGGVA